MADRSVQLTSTANTRRGRDALILMVVCATLAAACGASGAATSEGAASTIDPIVEANAAGNVALCNDGGFSTNTDFTATCSGGEGVDRWLATFGECSDGRVIVMGDNASCEDNGGFKGLLPADFQPEASGDDVALCNDGNFSDNTDFSAACSGGEGVDRWLATFGECSDGSTITMSIDAACPDGADFVGLRAADFEPEPATATTVVSTTTAITTTVAPPTTVVATTSPTTATTVVATTTPPPPPPPPPPAPPTNVSYANCDAVRAAGAAPIRRGDPGYSTKLDRDGDGIGCE